ncbi:MAG: glycerol kinase GlpK [Synergistaceae bacterium]|jgi:glycerol kinase|nr:glycerol kinase GlpK [Synergistaceae bacterium]
MGKYILGIDQGTTGTKVIIFDRQANQVATGYSEFTQHFPRDGWVEHDAEEIWGVTLKVVGEALKSGNIEINDIAAIGITNQRVTTLLWDRKTGKPAARAIVWQDRRNLGICERLIEKDRAGFEGRTGMLIIPNASGPKVEWLLENNDGVRKGVEEGRLIFGNIDAWLVWKLSGGAAHVTEPSNACETLMMNALTLDWDEPMLKEMGIPRGILPEIRSSSEIYAYTDPDVFFGAKIPIAGICGDQQAATFGQACFEPGMAKNTYGTGSFMIMNTGDRYIPPKGQLIAPVLWQIKGKHQYGLEGLVDVSGAVIQWLRDGLGIISKAQEAEELAKQVPDTAGVFFVPAFVGLGAPHFDSYARGSILGLTRGSTKHHISRAALESMAYQVRDAFEIMKKDSGLELTKLRVDGGGAKSDLSMQFQADILGIPVERPVITETTVLGAAYLAGLAVGYWESLDEITANWKVERTFEPQIGEDEREHRYAGWKRAIERAAGWLKF